MKKLLLSVWPFLPLALLLLVLAGNALVRKYAAPETPAELYYRPAILYQDELYLVTSNKPFRTLRAESLACAGVLAEDVTIHRLPTENMQSCGCEHLVGRSIYLCAEYPDYLFLYDERETLYPFIRESAIAK